VTATPPLHVKLAFYLLGIRPRAEWRPWARCAVSRPPTWSWIVGARVGFGLTLGAVLFAARSGDWLFTFKFLLAFLLVMIPLAVSLNDGERSRRREIARLDGDGTRKRPANAALTTVCLLQVGVTLVTNGRQGPTLDRVQWALLVAMLLTGAWFFHERRVLDRDLDETVGQVADPNGQR